MDSSRLLICPNRPYLLLRCRGHEIHVPAGGRRSPHREIAFTMDVYAVTGQLHSSCYAIYGDTYSTGIASDGLSFYWECAFIDDDRVAVAYRWSRIFFGRNGLNILFYDISKRQFRTYFVALTDVISAPDESIDDRYRTTEFYAMDFDGYTLKKDRLLVILPPNSRGYRAIVSYRLQWPDEALPTPSKAFLWELKSEWYVFVRPPADFRTNGLLSCFYGGVADENDRFLCVFDGLENGARYARFIQVDLNRKNMNLREPTWTYCSVDESGFTYPPHISDCATVAYFCDSTGRVYLRNLLSYLWFLEKDEENFKWMERQLQVPMKPKISERPLSFAVNEQGGVYDLDDDREPCFCGYAMVNKEPPSLKLLAITRFLDSLGEKVGEEILCRSKEEIREKGYPQWVANLALK